MTAKICLTFDEWPEASTNAFNIMQPLGLVGTYFVTPSMIDGPGGAALNSLLAMKEFGWEIGVYSGVNMANLWTTSRIQASDKLKSLKDAMWSKGIEVRSFAAGQRAWNARLAELSDCYDFVRVADEYRSTTGQWGHFPITDNRYIRGGATNSLDVVDTAASLSAQVDDLISLGGFWNVIVHRVADSGSSRIGTAAFTGFCQKIASEVALGTLECVRFDKLVESGS